MIITHGDDFLSGCPRVTIFVETLSGEWLEMGASGELAGRGQWFLELSSQRDQNTPIQVDRV